MVSVFHVETSLWDSRKGFASRSCGIEERKGARIRDGAFQGKNGRILARILGKSSKNFGKTRQSAHICEDQRDFGGFRPMQLGSKRVQLENMHVQFAGVRVQ